MLKPRHLCCLLIMLLCLGASGEVEEVLSSGPRLAVIPFGHSAQTDLEKSDIAAMRRIAERELLSLKQFTPMSKDEIDQFFTENNIPPEEVYRSESKRKLIEGGVDYVLTGDVDTHKNSYYVRLYLLDAARGYFVTSHIAEFKKTGRELRNGVRKLVLDFTRSGQFIDAYSNRIAEMPVYKIGDTGPSGGIVFFAKPYYSDGWRYLEAAPADVKVNAPWGFYTDGEWIPEVAQTSVRIGEGMRNTVAISHGIIIKSQLSAAEACARLSHNGYTDWFLPSRDELNALYHNIAKQKLGDFAGGSYWSSSQSSKETAWSQRFEDGRQYYTARKIELMFVRPVRAF